ncbi:MAG: ATP-binding protein [bacterium]
MKELEFKKEPAFVDREREMGELKNYLETRPEAILFLYGSKSSGKTTLLYRLCAEMEKESRYEIKFLNLREIFLENYDDFLKVFFKAGEEVSGLTVGTRRKYSLVGLFHLDAFTEKVLKKKEEDPFLVMKKELSSLVKKGKQPVIIIDEFHKLREVYMANGQRRLIDELMNFFVAMTKENHLCQVIIASSDAFFIEEVYVDSTLRKTSEFLKLDYFDREQVNEWLNNLERYSAIRDYTLSQDEIEIIWDTVGGSPWEIQSILGQLFQKSLTEVVARLRRERVATIVDIIRRDRERREPLLRMFREKPAVRASELMDAPAEVLGQLVHDNILYYDPVDGLYGLQGRSMELGVREYFEQV